MRHNFSAKPGTRVCSLHFKTKKAQSRGVSFQLYSPRSQPRDLLFNIPLSSRTGEMVACAKLGTRPELNEGSLETTQAAGVLIVNNFDNCFHYYIFLPSYVRARSIDRIPE